MKNIQKKIIKIQKLNEIISPPKNRKIIKNKLWKKENIYKNKIR